MTDHEQTLDALIVAINASEGAGFLLLTKRLRFEVALFVYEHRVPIATFETIARKRGWEWDGKASPLKDIARPLGLVKSHVKEHCS